MSLSARDPRRHPLGPHVSTVEVCQSALDRIDAADPALNAFRTVDAERALARAAALDARRSEDSHLPLFGVPVALKDNLCTRGLRDDRRLAHPRALRAAVRRDRRRTPRSGRRR